MKKKLITAMLSLSMIIPFGNQSIIANAAVQNNFITAEQESTKDDMTISSSEDDLIVNVPSVNATNRISLNATNFPDPNFRLFLQRTYSLLWDYPSDPSEITSIDPSRITKIETVLGTNITNFKGIEFFTNLTSLDIYNPDVKSLNLSQNTALKSLYIYSHYIKSLDLSKNTSLEELTISRSSLTSLNLSKNTNLTKLAIYESPNFSNLTLGTHNNLKDIRCPNAKISSINLNGCPNLETLIVYNNKLTTLNLSHNLKLTDLVCNDNRLMSLNVKNNSALSVLKIDNNYLACLDLAKDAHITNCDNGTQKIPASIFYSVKRGYLDMSLFPNFNSNKVSSLEYATMKNNIINFGTPAINNDYIQYYYNTGAENSILLKYIRVDIIDVKNAYYSDLDTPKISSVSNTASGVKIEWSEIFGAEKYRVFRKSNPASTAWEIIGDTTGTSFSDKTAKSGTTYIYTIRCINAAGDAYTSAYDKTGKSIKFISAPVISTLSNTTSGVKVAWGKVSGAVNYRVYRRTSGSSWSKLTDTTATTFTDKTAKSGTTYTYTVKCINAAGTKAESAYDKTGKSIKFISAPVISSLSNTTSGVKITWGKVTGAVNYRVYRRTSTTSSWSKLTDTAATSFVDKTAKKGTTYYYTVKCINTAGTKAESAYNKTGKSITVK